MQTCILAPKAGAYFSFTRGSSLQDYPRSYLGAAALLRQMRLDAVWYASGGNKEQTNLSLAALHATSTLPQIIDVPNKHFALLAADIGKETKIDYIIKGAGDEYQRAEEIFRTGATFILPLTYPKAHKVVEPYAGLDTRLSALKHWELAPYNAAILAKKGVRFAFTSHGLSNPNNVLPNVRTAIKCGLPKALALAALTEQPAKILRIADRIGTLSVGKYANFFVASADIFEEKEAVIYMHVIQGKHHLIHSMDDPNYSGVYALKIGDTRYDLHITGPRTKQKATINTVGNKAQKYTVKLAHNNYNIHLFFHPVGKPNAWIRLSGWKNGNDIQGRGQDTTGQWIDFIAQYRSLPTPPALKKEKPQTPIRMPLPEAMASIPYPFVGFGNKQLPKAHTYLIQGATLWTNEPQGRVENTDLLVQDKKNKSTW